LSTAEAQDRLLSNGCSVEVPVQQPSDAPLSLQNLHFFTGGASYGMVNIFSRSQKAVAHYLIVLEMFAKDGEYLMSIPIFTSDANGEIPFDVSFKSWLEENGSYGEPLPPEGTADVPLHSQFTLLACP